jgi:hypothetical protein
VKPPPVVPPPKVETVSLHDALLAQLSGITTMTAEARTALVESYESAAAHKALAAHASGGLYRTVSAPAADDAEQATLEGCQIYYNGPCSLLAVDGTSRGDANGQLAPRDMPRVHYAGNFAVDQIPVISRVVRNRTDVQFYAIAPAAKAIAFHPWGQIYPATGGPNQREAELRALAACNGEPSRQGQGAGPCYLYAVADQVVLPRRLREPLTPVIEGVTPPHPAPMPAPAPVSTDDAELKDALIQRLANITHNTRASAEMSVTRYLASAADHRAIAAAEGTVGVGAQPTLIGAEIIALEKCQLLRGAPCALLGSDREVAPVSPPAGSKWSVRDMPRVGYDSYFDVLWIPGVDDTVRKRPDVAGYLLAPLPKAAATGLGGLVIVTQAKSQFEAESQALAKCGYTCWLYATGNQVVLPQRRMAPRPVGRSLADVISYMLAKDQGPAISANYSKFRTHRAMAALPETGQLYTWANSGGIDLAEQVALEGCNLRYNALCVAIAADDALRTYDPSTAPRRQMQRLTYQGPYRADMVPMYETTPNEAREYATMREPKAMAIRPTGPKIAIAGGRTLAEAEEQALAQCTDPDSPFPCFLYAVNGQTILPERRTEPTR